MFICRDFLFCTRSVIGRSLLSSVKQWTCGFATTGGHCHLQWASDGAFGAMEFLSWNLGTTRAHTETDQLTSRQSGEYRLGKRLDFEERTVEGLESHLNASIDDRCLD